MDKVTLVHLLVTDRLDELHKLFANSLPADIADALLELEDEQLFQLVQHLSHEELAMILEELDTEEGSRLLALIPDDRVPEVISEMSSDDAADLLAELSDEQREVLLNNLAEDAEDVRELLLYDEDSSGGIMATEFLSARPHWTAEQALASVRRNAREAETAYYVYVIDENGKLVGVVSLRELVLAHPKTQVSEVMHQNLVVVHDEEDQETVAAIFRRYDLLALPVVDADNILKGIVTADDIIDVVDDEATEDIHRMAALQPSEDDYLQTPVVKLASRRIVWLLVLMISATFTGGIIRIYEDALEQMVLLAVFIPMLMDTAGNSGSQSATLIIRSLALGQLTPQDWAKVMSREIRVSFMVGGAMGAINFLRLITLERYSADIALVVSFTLLITVVMSKIFGGLLPLGAKMLRIDPAVMAGPLITTIVDALALIVYFRLATTFLGLA